MIDLITLKRDKYFSNLKKRQERAGEAVEFYSNAVGISSDNEYIPITASTINMGIYSGKIIHYGVPNYLPGQNVAKGYKLLYKFLDLNSVPNAFKTKSMEEPLFAMKGILFRKIEEDIEILFSVVVKTEYTKQMHEEDREGRPLDYSKFAILVSNKFCTSAQYKTIYNKFYREIILPHSNKGVDVIITNNIVNRCFKSNLKRLKFKSITEMKEYLFAFNKAI